MEFLIAPFTEVYGGFTEFPYPNQTRTKVDSDRLYPYGFGKSGRVAKGQAASPFNGAAPATARR